MSTRTLSTGIGAVIACLALTSCSGSNSADVPSSPVPPGTTGASESQASTTSEPSEDWAELAASVPEEFRGRPLAVVMGEELVPIYYRHESGELRGVTKDLAEEIARRLDLELDISAAGFDTVIPGLTSGRYDISIYAASIRPDRLEVVDMIGFIQVAYNFMSWDPDPQVHLESEADACGANVAILAQHAFIETLEEQSEECVNNGQEPITLSTFPSHAAANLAVRSGQADFSLMDNILAAGLLESDDRWQVVSPHINPHDSGFALPKDSGLSEPWRATFESLLVDGTYDAILEDHNVPGVAIDHATLNPVAP